jgi:putative protease
MTKIELLAPAKNLQIGIEAIKHGADAVYIGGPKFGARAAAGNSINEIKQLCDFAHIYCAKVYVTLNTIIYDNELEEVRQYICTLYEIGVDALIVQDLAICSLPLPPIEIHASTQLDVTSVEKVQLLEQLGFRQVVLARELSLKQIANIKATTNVKLEAFIHGALCVVIVVDVMLLNIALIALLIVDNVRNFADFHSASKMQKDGSFKKTSIYYPYAI